VLWPLTTGNKKYFNIVNVEILYFFSLLLVNVSICVAQQRQPSSNRLVLCTQNVFDKRLHTASVQTL